MCQKIIAHRVTDRQLVDVLQTNLQTSSLRQFAQSLGLAGVHVEFQIQVSPGQLLARCIWLDDQLETHSTAQHVNQTLTEHSQG